MTATSVPRNPTANLHIGAYDSSDTQGLNGMIDEVRVYKRALTIPEVQDLFTGVPADLGPVISVAGSVSGVAGQPFTLNGTVTDDGVPAATTVQWSKLSGPGFVAFGNAAQAATTGTAAFGGSYTLQLAANDGAITTVANVAASIAQTYSAWASQHNLTGANASARPTRPRTASPT